MTADEAEGVLAIWNDIRADRVADFEFWYKNEHFPERLAVPGFKLGRRYEAVAGSPRYFCYYLTATPATLTSPAYLERLNNPTPLTRSMMSDAFQNMHRTACRRIRRAGALSAGLCVTARFAQTPDPQALDTLLAGIDGADGIARAELWASVEQPQATRAKEETLRGGDRKIASCLMVETLREADAQRVSRQIEAAFGADPREGGAAIGTYRLVCELAAAKA